jgi:hypothetical protein
MSKKSLFILVPVFLAVLGLAFAGCGKKGGETKKEGEGEKKEGSETKTEKPDLAQAVPVWEMFVAIRDDKPDDFKKCFTKKRIGEMEKDGMKENFEGWGGEVKKRFGTDFKLADFEFTFEGDDAKGNVGGKFKGKEMSEMDVAKEGDAWKIDER